MTIEGVTITLTPDEIVHAARVAVDRVLFALQNRTTERYGVKSDFGGFDYNFIGCLGEIATAKHFNLHWSPTLGAFHLRDVGGRLQTRASGRADHDLILHPNDKDEDVFVSATVLPQCLPRVLLCGWLIAADGKQKEFWRDGNGNGRTAFFVPLDRLRKIGELAT